MIKKRVLIGSFILIITGLFFMLGTNSGITGAAIGISTGALNPASSTLFGFFLIWIAGIMLISTVDEKVTTEVLKKREKKAADWGTNQSTRFTEAYTEEIKKTGKELSDLTDEEKSDVAHGIYKKIGDDYVKNFLKLNSTEYFGKSRLETLYLEDAKVSDKDIENLASNLNLVSLSDSYKKATSNVLQRLNSDIFSDVYRNKGNIGSLAKEFQAKLGIKKDNVKNIEDVRGLYNILKEKEKGKELNNALDKVLEKYKK